MKELIARLEKKEPCFITLLVSMEPDNATFDGPEIYFSADCYENPEERFKLSEIFKEEKDTYGLEGFDGRDDIQIFFSFSGKK